MGGDWVATVPADACLPARGSPLWDCRAAAEHNTGAVQEPGERAEQRAGAGPAGLTASGHGELENQWCPSKQQKRSTERPSENAAHTQQPEMGRPGTAGLCNIKCWPRNRRPEARHTTNPSLAVLPRSPVKGAALQRRKRPQGLKEGKGNS